MPDRQSTRTRSLIASAYATVYHTKQWIYQASMPSETALKSTLLSAARSAPDFSNHNVNTGRKQCVKTNGETSDFNNIQCGVPQESLVGPLLYLCNSNDMCLSVKTRLLRV